ncbi:hypothetical protein SAMN05216238_1123 [Lentibacillus persicus]|uniref:Uncharacterized protein n=1 Tax=Lentibacillus persicus TaxID=640948 RepID=A0A1I1Z9B9_9BACI|nr:hypothetical protein [Lentibacillus persicus]SFE28142.1 hypothetical protein SAMN05216238_1123 [Lentibacillus persicus]
MSSWTIWLATGLAVSGVIYAVYSVFAKKPIGLYISAVFHIVLGILSLFSISFAIGLYVLSLAIVELIAGIILNDSVIIKKTIHITNIILLVGLLALGFFCVLRIAFCSSTRSLHIRTHTYYAYLRYMGDRLLPANKTINYKKLCNYFGCFLNNSGIELLLWLLRHYVFRILLRIE